MKFSVAAVVAFATAGLAQPILTNSDYTIEEGKPFTITWSNAQGPVTLTLKNGPSDDLQTVDVIISGASGSAGEGSFTWTPEDLPTDTYAIEISDASGEPNYSPQFEYSGTGPAPSASTSAKSTASPSVTSSASESSVTSSASETSSAPESSSTAESSSSSSSSSTATRTTTTRAIPTPTNQNSEGQRFSSPLALLLVTVAAVFFFN